jgi:hypothetical protein
MEETSIKPERIASRKLSIMIQEEEFKTDRKWSVPAISCGSII